MRRLSRSAGPIAAIAMIVCAAHPTLIAQAARQNAGRGSGTPEQQVLQADDERFAAMLKGDVPALERLLAVELTYIRPNARLEDKHALLYDIKSGNLKFVTLIPTERKVHVMGNIAVITGVCGMRGSDRGTDMDMTVRYTDVNVLRDGRWQMVSWQATRVVPSDKVIPGGPA